MRGDGWKWHLKHNNQDYGPISHRELLLFAGLGKLGAADRVWAPGFPGWVPASSVPGLFQPALSVQTSWQHSWQGAVAFFHTSWTRMRQWATAFHWNINTCHAKAAIQFPAVWFGTAAGVVLVIIVASTQNIIANTQNPNRSFAPATPELSSVVQGADLMPPLSIVRAPVAVNVPITKPTPAIEEKPTPFIEEADADDAARDGLKADGSPALIEDAVPLPDRKAIPEVTRRSIDTKEGARAVQRRLRQLGFLADEADGTWGPKSRIALKQFLRRANISPSSGWSRRAERVLFSANAPRNIINAHNPFLAASF